MEFDGLTTAGTFADVTEIPEGCNIVGGYISGRVTHTVWLTGRKLEW